MSDAQHVLHRVLFLAHSHAFGPFRVGSHHYARTLALSGLEVVHLSTPISLAHRATGRVDRHADAAVPRGPYADADGVTHLVPRTVAPRPYGPFRVANELRRADIHPDFDAVLIDQPLLWDRSVRALSPRLVYRPTDLYPEGVKAQLQSRVLAASDGVVATSGEVLRALGAVVVPTLVLPNGVDARVFAAGVGGVGGGAEVEGSGVAGAVRSGCGAGGSASRPARAVYVGALDARFDWARMTAWAQTHPEVEFVIAGPSGVAPAGTPSNVSLLGAVAYDSLPALLQSARVGLLPLSDDPLNAGRSPMKLYEYLAAGLAVVARQTPVLQADAAAGVFTYARADEADAALARALRHPSPNVAGVFAAAGASWDAKTAALVEFVAGLTG